MGCNSTKLQTPSLHETELLFDATDTNSNQMDALNALAEMKLILYQYNLLHQKLNDVSQNQQEFDALQSRRKDLHDRFKELNKRNPSSMLSKNFKTLDKNWKEKTKMYIEVEYFLPSD